MEEVLLLVLNLGGGLEGGVAGGAEGKVGGVGFGVFGRGFDVGGGGVGYGGVALCCRVRGSGQYGVCLVRGLGFVRWGRTYRCTHLQPSSASLQAPPP